MYLEIKNEYKAQLQQKCMIEAEQKHIPKDIFIKSNRQVQENRRKR